MTEGEVKDLFNTLKDRLTSLSLSNPIVLLAIAALAFALLSEEEQDRIKGGVTSQLAKVRALATLIRG